MCIAIYKPAGKELSDEALRACFDSNPDGAGFAYINTDQQGVKRLVIKKYLDYPSFKHQYDRAVRIAPESPMLVHFRIKTHGTISVFNCHPFKIDSNHAFIHNGTVKGMKHDSVRSDTQMFNDGFLKNLGEGWMEDDGVKNLIEHVIDYSKIVVMNLEGDVQIYNESKGHWKDDIWYSNHSYVPPKPVPAFDDLDDYWDRKYGRAWQGGHRRCAYPNPHIVKTLKDIKKDEKLPKVIGKYDIRKCDGCGVSYSVCALQPYVVIDDTVGYCYQCQASVLSNKSVLPSDRITNEQFIILLNLKEPLEDEVTPHMLESNVAIEDWSPPNEEDVIDGQEYYEEQEQRLLN